MRSPETRARIVPHLGTIPPTLASIIRRCGLGSISAPTCIKLAVPEMLQALPASS